VAGCEVLVRWRDVDGTIVPPSRFIEIVPRLGRTAEFTKIVADRAYDELADHVAPNLRLQVSFNVFACDFTSTKLLQIFSRFMDEPRRFDLAIELVENQDINFEEAQRTIQELRRAGVSVYIDDFGIGYSSIERVAILDVHGVKLDRSFAMAPRDSILGRMLMQVLEMMKTSGHSIVIEGVETESQLDLLRAAGSVDYLQGYVIAPPLGISEFVRFLANYRPFAARPVATNPDVVRPSAALRRLQSG
jgi:sensor c-di-GMP phosphodiesterase-like protein